ncbi:SDR family NAD(P)-dependent oxidoreductase [Thermochromatium tepidum]|uniref:SDR family NAD(P)-dependent oxidoreductase n=1 Tax=Thermochromatium tepidum ATCC 43061 TaxID=316276 RepID=A0A6I6DY36_THETI|nr:SDR family NAD(P)-dependent oxidoreductase [Thermochromatium tepidum]QGU31665.1 SDR family NAD(P)-dependent oxidoreductase [Thermochromatium tepidum ATCC 43061]
MSTDPSSNSNGGQLQDRVILVTGALEGLGRAVALACAAAGATVILSSFEQADLEPVYDRILDAGHPEPAILPLNLETATERDFLAAADVILDTFGRLDGLAHCAASAPFLSRIDDYDASEWERVIRINLNAPFMLTQACLPLLRLSADASIVFTSDRVGRRGLAYWGAYAAAKFGIEGLMQVLAEETRASSHIRVNSLDPGVLRTALRAHLYPGEDPNRHPDPETVAGAYVQLLGPEGRGLTGCALRVENGRAC